MIDDNDTRYVRNQRQYAGNLVALAKVPGAAGISWGEAFAMISSRPAEAVGLGKEIGSLAAGRRADVVIWSGDPLELNSAPEEVWIDGVRQPCHTRFERRSLPSWARGDSRDSTRWSHWRPSAG
jgi:adenine deaminase